MAVMRRIGLGLAGTVALGIIVACGQATPGAQSPPAATRQPTPVAQAPAAYTTSAATTAAPTAALVPAATTQSGELKIAVTSFLQEDFYPPPASNASNLNRVSPMFDIMFRGFGPEVEPGIVEKWQISSDGLSWTFNVRKGVKFHNGDDLTADDVKFSMDQYMKPGAANADLGKAVERIDKIDDYSLRVYTKGVLPFFPDLMSLKTPTQGFVMPKNYFEKNGLAYFQKNPVGSGPWKFVRHVPGDRVEYEAVNQHWRQVPAFKKLTIIQLPEEATRVAALKTGEVDFIDLSLDAARQLEAAGFKAAQVTTIAPHLYFFGSYDKRAAGMPLADLRVRQALSLAINRAEIGKTLFHGKTSPVMPPTLSDVSNDIDIPYWRDYAAKTYRYDLAEAKRLLGEAGVANGFNIKFYVSPISGAPFLAQLAQIIQNQWAQIGVKAEIVATDYGNIQTWRKGPDDRLVGAAFMGRDTAVVNTINQLRLSFSNKLPVYDLLGPAATEIDGLLDGANSEIDGAKRKQLVAKAVKIGADSFTTFQLEQVPSLIALGPKVDFNMPPQGVRYVPVIAEFVKHKK